jgi:hypothetical protein
MLLENTCEDFGLLDANIVIEEVYRRYDPVILWIAVNNSSSTSVQMDMKMVPKAKMTNDRKHTYLP